MRDSSLERQLFFVEGFYLIKFLYETANGAANY